MGAGPAIQEAFLLPDVQIRSATPADAAQIAAIYAPYVTDTVISFEDDAPTPVVIADRVRTTRMAYPYLVAESDGKVLAYAYGGPYRARRAYRFTAEVTAYASPQAQGQGVGRALYDRLLDDLVQARFHTAVAIITLPNQASVGFHESLGFQHMGTVAQVGHKFGSWHDTGIWQRHMSRPEVT